MNTVQMSRWTTDARTCGDGVDNVSFVRQGLRLPSHARIPVIFCVRDYGNSRPRFLLIVRDYRVSHVYTTASEIATAPEMTYNASNARTSPRSVIDRRESSRFANV